MSYDVIVIGAGHNGLTCAAYLARAGLRVKIVERRGVVGGAAVTEEFHPGFRNSVCSYVVSLLHPKVIADLDLHGHGLEIIGRPASTFNLLPDGRHLTLFEDTQATIREIARFSQHDAQAYETYATLLAEMALVLRSIVLETPPNLGGGIMDLLAAARTGNRLRKLSLEHQRAFMDLVTMSIGDYLDDWFESAALKGSLGYSGIVGNMVSPYSAGSAYVLLHHYFGETNGKVGAWGHAKGAWARSPRRWPARPRRAASRCRSRRRSRRSLSKAAGRAASCSPTAPRSAPVRLPPTSIPSCCFSISLIARHSTTTSGAIWSAGAAVRAPSA